jgi:hypothetical protein
MTLARTVSEVRNSDGSIKELYCKVCGRLIGEAVGREFIRNDWFAEIKMRMDDGSFHISVGCSKCLADMPIPAMKELFDSDIAEVLPGKVEAFKDRQPVRLVKFSNDQKGIE